MWHDGLRALVSGRTLLSRTAVDWALRRVALESVSISACARTLGCSWNTLDRAVRAHGMRILSRSDPYARAFANWPEARGARFRDRVEVVAMDAFSCWKQAAARMLAPRGRGRRPVPRRASGHRQAHHGALPPATRGHRKTRRQRRTPLRVSTRAAQNRPATHPTPARTHRRAAGRPRQRRAETGTRRLPAHHRLLLAQGPTPEPTHDCLCSIWDCGFSHVKVSGLVMGACRPLLQGLV